jgi:hypothetical protein
MATHEILISFPEVSPAQANQYAAELQDALRQASIDVSVERIRSDPEALDFGTTLAVILGTPAAIALATAVKRWLARRGTKLIVKTTTGEILAENLDSKDAAEIAAAFTRSEARP